MDRSSAFDTVKADIAKGNTADAGPRILMIASENPGDAIVLLTCASLLTAVGLSAERAEVVSMIAGNPPKDPGLRLEVSAGLRGLGEFGTALKLLEGLPDDDAVARERMEDLYGLNDFAGAHAAYSVIKNPKPGDEIRCVDIMCSLKDFKGADAKSIAMLAGAPDDYDVLKCRCSVLLRSGKQKEAERFVKDFLKKDKKSADANALASYFLYMCNKVSAAGGYASKAVQTDGRHVGAMEILALCLVEKGKPKEARIVAGAINEIVPGHPAVVRIIESCRE